MTMAMDTFLHGGSYLEVGVSNEKQPEWEVCMEMLRDVDPQQQTKAARKLKGCVEKQARELSTDAFEKWEAEVHRRVFERLDEKVCAVRWDVGASLGQFCIDHKTFVH